MITLRMLESEQNDSGTEIKRRCDKLGGRRMNNYNYLFMRSPDMRYPL